MDEKKVQELTKKIQETKIILNNDIKEFYTEDDRELKLLLWVVNAFRYEDPDEIILQNQAINIIFGNKAYTPKHRMNVILDRFKETHIADGLFDDIEYKKYSVAFRINKKFKKLYTNTTSNYMSFRFDRINGFSSHKPYIKMFLFLIERGDLNKRKTNTDELRKIEYVAPYAPNAYVRRISIEPIFEELKQTFKGLKVDYEKIDNNLDSAVFTWKNVDRGYVKAKINPATQLAKDNLFAEFDESSETNAKKFLQSYLRKHSLKLNSNTFDDFVRELDSHVLERYINQDEDPFMGM